MTTTRRRVLFLTSLLPLLSRFGGGQNSTTKSETASVLNKHMDWMEQSFMPAAEAMPQDRFLWAPKDGEFQGVRSFAEQIVHVAEVNFALSAAILGEQPSAEAVPSSETSSMRSAVLRYLKASFAYTHKALSSITEDNAAGAACSCVAETFLGCIWPLALKPPKSASDVDSWLCLCLQPKFAESNKIRTNPLNSALRRMMFQLARKRARLLAKPCPNTKARLLLFLADLAEHVVSGLSGALIGITPLSFISHQVHRARPHHRSVNDVVVDAVARFERSGRPERHRPPLCLHARHHGSGAVGAVGGVRGLPHRGAHPGDHRTLAATPYVVGGGHEALVGADVVVFRAHLQRAPVGERVWRRDVNCALLYVEL